MTDSDRTVPTRRAALMGFATLGAALGAAPARAQSAREAAGRFVAVDILYSKPGLEAELLAELRSVAEAERRAGEGRGLVSFDVLTGADADSEEGGAVMFHEVWRDRAAFDAFHADHRPAELTRFIEELAPRLLDRPLNESITFWVPSA